ncbi:hypothetical protein BH20ACI2_BH20ACI2_21710 [soil metagenome]
MKMISPATDRIKKYPLVSTIDLYVVDQLGPQIGGQILFVITRRKNYMHPNTDV